MTKNQIIELQRRVGTIPDGFWGRMSTQACQRYLRKLMENCPDYPSIPTTGQVSLTKAYGKPGDVSQLVNLDVQGLKVRYNGALVKTVRVHKACAKSLKLIIQELSTFADGQVAISKYAGCFNDRPMRGGSLPSLHARGAAIDLMARTNRNKQHWPASANMPFSVMEVFAKHGWLSAGAFWSRDGMHFQRTK